MNWHFKNIALYPKNSSPSLDTELFRNPTSEYRGTPFWAWNARLDRSTLMRQIEVFAEMGLGGFHMHTRTGLDTEYLSSEYMGFVRECTLKAKEMKMISWLYDEDRWPSGAAGGLVTKDPELRTRHLLWTMRPYVNEKGAGYDLKSDGGYRGLNGRQNSGTLLGRYEVVLEQGLLKRYRRLKDGEAAEQGARIWYAYMETAGASSWFNNQAYVDTLNPRAIEKFVKVTHERYKACVGEFFGGVIPAMFTDEPQFAHKQQFKNADEMRDVLLPFTPDFYETYAATYGQRLEESLPELFWELPGGEVSVARYRYHDHVAERFASAFADTCGKWCADNGIALTGHMMDEPSLHSQTSSLGEAMRSYRAFQLPGIDMLCDHLEYTTAKQAQSAAHQYGRPGVLSELYGVTNWDYDFVGHKAQGDWQAALGVTVRVPHLAWVSMAGEAKRDYPAAIDDHSPWYREYRLVEDHFARVNVALTRGTPLVRVGVIHPVESYWLAFGPLQQTKLAREELERSFSDVTQWLLFGMIDFNYISESLLPELCPSASGSQLRVGQMAYDVVVVPNMRTIRSSTLSRLEAFASAGGRVVFMGEVPTLVDAQPSDAPAKLAARCHRIDASRGQLLASVEDLRDVDVRLSDGGRADSILYQFRADGESRQVFFAQTDRIRAKDDCVIRLRGIFTPMQLESFSGDVRPVGHYHEGGWTMVPWSFSAHGHLLLTLCPAKMQIARSSFTRPAAVRLIEQARLGDPVRITLSEPNVLLLDQPQWRLGESGAWNAREELLRIDNLVRTQLNLPKREGGIAQPWTDTAPDPVAATLQLRFVIRSEVAVASPQLALEDVQHAKVTLNGSPVASRPTGQFVDAAIQTIALPALAAGENELIVSYAYSRKRNVEWMYLLGDFGVAVAGRDAWVTAPVRTLRFGDFTHQGLPFYAGNVTYHCTFAAGNSPLTLEVAKFKAPLLSVDLDGKPCGKIAFAPFQLTLGELVPGEHRLDITAYGNRHNAFGALHNCDERLLWFGPAAWRSSDANWSYEYQLRRMGVLVAPMLKTAEQKR